MDIHKLLAQCEGFEWDDGNSGKNWEKHRVADSECEQVFFNTPLIALSDVRHSHTERRFYVLGQTDAGRQLFAAFTIRNFLMRIISARDMTRKESEAYQRAKSQE